ncbi:MAG: Glycerol-3-phosphate dehydrogenase [NAD(P)+] [Candidatus Jorgensenbacteria bacterium GW2011_GWA2_45_13]|uniref:Glycerol-3-phosphate dehydrogenase [NAD(P)+] n=1 Tax=Candidatus Jorgensenbacteria bacterium GW2011_GWA2_45_13 TaxID=1618662 RepID=A0A0G1P2G1_9BACT|nr:MAG: Glycerol-3-phosphate dehydrogenase [NAD(P)+] [Candidatus Jorgensenbacteria bacterium GW2011_GWA2_45_13]
MQKEGMNVVIIGAGRIGKTLGGILKKNNARVSFWDVKRGLVARQKPLSQTLPEANFVFLCMPSWGYRSVLRRMKPHLPRHTIIVSLAKGIEPNLKTTVDVAVKKMFPRNPLCVFGGPMLAEEIEKGMAGIGVIASTQEEASKSVCELFSNAPLFLECSTDVFGTAIAGVLKNAYSLAFGVAEGLKWNNNARGWLFSSAVREMVRAGTVLGGRKETFEGLAGIGDFAACVFSSHSRHHKAGIELSQRGKCSVKNEGIASVPFLTKMLRKRRIEFSILFTLARAVKDGRTTRRVFAKLAPWR